MAVKKLKAVSPDKLLNKGADMKPVTTGQLNNQVIPEVNADVSANTSLIQKNTDQGTENSNGIAANSAAVAPLAGIAKGVFTSCAAAVSGGVTAGQLYVLRQTYVINNGEENINKITDTIVLMGAECPE
tara:strand:+ start:256 stop:642 length:387 start_codon:yes stop_codon:yes gene_type:complete